MCKKLLVYILIVVFAFTNFGCSERLKRKFIRRSDKKEEITPVFHPEEYKKAFPNKQLYLNHFTLWKTAQSELITRLGQNSKKDSVLATSSLSELNDAKRYLIESKQRELDPFITELETIVKNITAGSPSYAKIGTIKRDLERHKRKVEKNFSFHKMESFVIPE